MTEFLDIDPEQLTNEKLMELAELLKGSEKHRDLLLSLRGELIRRVRKKLSVPEIVRLLTRNRAKVDRELLAREWSGPLGINENEFRKIANQR